VFRVKLECDGFSPSLGPQAATDVAEEFAHRPWHENVTCIWNGTALVLTAENDDDENGLALIDEFSDAVTACIGDTENTISIRLVEVTELQ
jgi:hypothetical protein